MQAPPRSEDPTRADDGLTCECGCGGQPKLGKRYIHNHHWRGKKRPFRAQSAEANEKRAATQRQYPKASVCAIEGCELPRKQRAWCSKHYTRWLRYGDTSIVQERGWSVPSDQHPAWKGDEAGYGALHEWLRKHHPKTGVCQHCGEAASTHYAFRFHPRPYTRKVGDYLELCPTCHRRFDKG